MARCYLRARNHFFSCSWILQPWFLPVALLFEESQAMANLGGLGFDVIRRES